MARKKKLPVGMRYRPDRGGIEYRFKLDGKQYSVYGSTISECREKELQKREEVQNGSYTRSRDLTVSEYMELWLGHKEDSTASSTVRTRRKLANRMIRQPIDKAGHTFGKLKMSELETEHIRQLQKSLTSDGLHSRTANETLSLLKQALQDAVNERAIEWNPAKAVKSLKQKEEPARDTIHRALTREEVETFLKAAAASWYYPLYVFLLHTGLRIGEASALTIRDVTDSYIRVYKTVTRTKAGYIIEEQTKTAAGRRTVPTRPEAWKAFQDQRRYNEMLNSRRVINLNSPVFTLPKGGIIRPDRVNCDIKRICEKTGIEYFTCHAWRATFTSRCIADGMPVKLLMEILGHTDVQMTLGLYGHGEDLQKKEHLLAVNM